MTKPQTAEVIFFFALLALVGYFAFVIMQPYLTILFLAVVLTLVFGPLYQRLLSMFGQRENLAGLVTVFLVLVLILTPLLVLGFLLFDEIVRLYASFNSGGMGVATINQWTANLQNIVRGFIPTFTLDIDVYNYVSRTLTFLAEHSNTFISGFIGFFFNAFLIIIAMFFLLRDGKKLKEFAIKWSPLADSYDETIIAKLEAAVSSVVKGTLATAIGQGVIAGLGFAMFGVPNPVLLGVVSALAALIPLIGTSIVTIPAAVLLFFNGSVYSAIGLLVYSIVFIATADNIIRPMVLKRGMNVHPFLILLSVFGGLVYFGPIGFLAGPIVMAFFFVLLDIYPILIKGREPKEG